MNQYEINKSLLSAKKQELVTLKTNKELIEKEIAELESKLFPEMILQSMINDHNLIMRPYGDYGPTIEGYFIKVWLPVSNSHWTFTTFDWVKSFVKMFPDSWPEHATGFNAQFIYINCRLYLKLH